MSDADGAGGAGAGNSSAVSVAELITEGSSRSFRYKPLLLG